MLVLLLIGCGSPFAAPGSGGDDWHCADLRRFSAAEATQGVAVDDRHFYAIASRAVGKYRKDTGERVASWEGGKGDRIKHLNAGIVLDGKLYCAHSNFPDMPEQCSVEIWDATSLRHLGEHRFEKPPGSLTWVDRRDGHWFACFAHYRKTSDPALTQVVKFDAGWRRIATWTFPAGLIERFAGSSSSGGSFGPGAHLFVTGHDAKELYVLDVPENGGELIWRDTISISAAGQAFAWDRAEGDMLYSIQRKTKEVIVSRISCRGARDALHARCLVLDDGTTKLGLVVCDLLHTGYYVSREARRLIKEKTGIPPEHVLISAVHTHSGCSAMGSKTLEGYPL